MMHTRPRCRRQFLERLCAAIVAVLVTPLLHAADLPKVTVAEVRQGSALRELPVTGTVTAERAASLSPRVSGLVTRVHVDAGHRVKEGDVLLDMDAAIARHALARAEAAIGEAQAQLAEAQRLQREARTLVERRTMPETQLHAANAEVELRRAALARLQAERDQQREIVERHTLRAPFSGVISRKLAEAGEWVDTGTAVLELVALDRLRLDVQVPQEHTAAIDADTPVDLVLDADPGRRHPARVVAKVPVQDPTARSFLVRIEPEEPLPLMMPGMSGCAIFSLRREEALLLPRDAIVMEPDGTRIVWVVEEQDGIGTVSRRPVEIVNSLEESVELRSGVSAGTRVVLHGNETLREGQSVRVLADR